jgi:hypothetical protein
MRLPAMALPALVCAFLLFGLGAVISKKTTNPRKRIALLLAGVLLSIPGGLFIAYYTHFFDNAAWFYNFRALPGIEIAAAGLGFLAGITYTWLEPESLGEKVFLPGVLFILVLGPFAKPLLDALDYERLSDRWKDGICLQSTFSTCGPSSAATILKAFGQDASEQELAKECYTSRGGTEIWYIMRALRKRGFRTNVVIQSTENPLPETPAIAGVVLRGGSGHFIAVMSETGGQVVIADPLVGRLVVKREDLYRTYHFTGFFLTVQPLRGVR